MRVIYGLSVVSGLWDGKGFYITDGGRKISSFKKKEKYLYEPQNFATQYKAMGLCALPNLPGRTAREFRPFGGAMLGSPILSLRRKQRRQMHNHLRQNMCPAHQNRSLANGPSHPRLDPEEIQMADVSGVSRPAPLLAHWIATFSGWKHGPGQSCVSGTNSPRTWLHSAHFHKEEWGRGDWLWGPSLIHHQVTSHSGGHPLT